MPNEFQVLTMVDSIGDGLVGLNILDPETGESVAQVMLRRTMSAEQRKKIAFRIADLLERR